MFFRPLATPYGAGRRYLGLLDGALGNLDAALEHLEAAQGLHARMNARPWLAITGVDLAAIRLRRGAAGDARLAQHHLREAERLARALGMHGVLDRIGSLRIERAADVRLH